MGLISKSDMPKRKKAIYAVESQHRRPGDLGISILVMARNPAQALCIARKLYPEHTSIKGNFGRILEVNHAFFDWTTGQAFITRERRRPPIKAVTDGHTSK